MKEETVNFAPPNWLFRRPPYLLSGTGQAVGTQAGSKKSRAIIDVEPLAGQVSQKLPKLGIHHQKVIEGALVRSDIPSRFPCMYCGSEKEITIDLTVRQIMWDCPGCGRSSSDNIMNVKQKDISKLSEKDQELLADLIQVSLYLHEPVLEKDWADLLSQPDTWQHWLKTERESAAVLSTKRTGVVDDDDEDDDGFDVTQAGVDDEDDEDELIEIDEAFIDSIFFEGGDDNVDEE
jgi:hypothetical protein